MKRGLLLASCACALFFAACGGRFSGPPPVTAAMRGETGTLAAGRKVFVSRCIECHALPEIAAHPATAWPGLVQRMAKRADLTPTEHDALLAYILAAHG